MSNNIKLPDIGDGNRQFPSEPPITPKSGGVFTPIQGWAYPYKGQPMEITVEVLASVKGVAPIGLRFVELCIKHFNFLALWDLKNTAYEMLLYGGKILLGREPENPKRYGRAVREIYRVLTIQFDKIDGLLNRKLSNIWKTIRGIICVLCEWDNAYRYRVQDFLIELNIENLIKNPIREIRRVLDIMIERENHEHLKNKWRRLKLFLTVFLILKPQVKKKIVEILSQINKTEIQFEDDDWYCICMRDDYNFGGMTTEQIKHLKGFN
jgi:hypothetical protein